MENIRVWPSHCRFHPRCYSEGCTQCHSENIHIHLFYCVDLSLAAEQSSKKTRMQPSGEQERSAPDESRVMQRYAHSFQEHRPKNPEPEGSWLPLQRALGHSAVVYEYLYQDAYFVHLTKAVRDVEIP